MANAGIYSAKNTSCIIGGVPMQGLADDNAYTLTQTEDGYTTTIGLDDAVVFAQNGASVMEVTIRLMHTSSANGVLQGFYAFGRINPLNAFRTFLFKDLTGTLVVTSDKCLVIKPADIVTSKAVPIREWKIQVADPIVVGGGNVASPFVIPTI
jgi:hypothetical protein